MKKDIEFYVLVEVERKWHIVVIGGLRPHVVEEEILSVVLDPCSCSVLIVIDIFISVL